MDNCSDTFSNTFRPGNVSISVIETAILSISFILNAIIFVSICCSPRLHTFSNVFVASLAVSDLLFAPAYGTLSAGNLYTVNTNLQLPCSPAFLCSSLYVVSCTMICSRLCHLVISAERWFYIAWPFVHQRVITSKLIICCLICVWFISMLSGVHIVTDCRSSPTEFMIGYATVDAAFHFVVGGLMLTIYVHIGFIIRRQSVAIHKSRLAANNNRGETIYNRMTWNIVRMPVTIFGTFFLFVTPIVIFNIYFFVSIGNPSFNYSNSTFDALKILAVFHTWANFFVYVLQDTDFRSVIKLCCSKITIAISSERIYPVNN
ncbi:unnamed protein product [Candidula unifasciata]|uniref:G-protein coupled receptors family 1 profile domain-containing protein n=1 Tax=Candidula unifasciata TaxID=100452 RepID=A0A8S4A8P0_9EUPU|nr:unnamed protein product [Candidula unifasciata]